MQSPASAELLAHLIRSSTPYRDPLDRVPWASVDLEGYWLPEQALSLYGIPGFESLPQERRWALSHYEFIHLLHAGLWSEALFMERLVRSLRDQDQSHLVYHLHELREEAGHSLMFLELLRRCPLPLPESPFPDLRVLAWLGRRLPFDSPAFWMGVLIGEELPDRMNRMVRRHKESVSPVVHAMMTLHVIDEARHITHARDVLAGLIKDARAWRRAVLRPLLAWALREYVPTLYFPPPSVYVLAGLRPGGRWARLARENPERHALIRRHLRPSLDFLAEHRLAVDTPW
jgi:hypothetical protein